MITKEMKETSKDLMTFLDECPTASHAVKAVEKRLLTKGFYEIKESEKWNLKPGDKFFLKRAGTAIAGGIIGKKPIVDTGFHVIGAHTDFPGFRIKSNSIYEKEGYIQLGVEIYGGPLLATWTDRDLSLAGRIIVNVNGEYETQLWKSEKTLLRISQVAIHLNREVNDKGLKLETEKHLPPVIGLVGDKPFTKDSLMEIIANDLNIEKSNIKEFELEIYDTQPSGFLGINDDFVVSGKLDNLMMCHASISSLCNLDETPNETIIIALFDNEEIGSSTQNGGASPLLENILERLSLTQNLSREEFLIAISKSFVMSADGAHAVHPNYTDLYEDKHYTHLNKGPVIKLNAKQRYATAPENTADILALAEKAEVPIQKYIHRTDKACGSTIGPITATKLGVKTIDLGHPMVSMHSIREMAGSADQFYMIKLMTEFVKSEY